MRVKALQLVSFAATLGFATSFSLAATTHASARPAHKVAVAARATAKHAELKPVAAGRKAAPLPTKEKRLLATRKDAHPKVAERVRLAPGAPAARPEPAAVPEDDIHVKHDRHQHFTADPTADEQAPRPATREDFLASDKPAEGEKPAPIVRREPAKVVVAAAVAVAMQYNRRGRLVVPPALKGSHEILLHQNEMADQDGLDRVRDDADLDDMRSTKLLVAIPEVAGLQTDERLPANRRYCRPWTAQFLMALARAHYAKFHSALQVNSAVRTVEFQQRLLLTNGNAAPAGGETASPHLTGQAIDLAKHGLSMTEIAWLRGYLLPLVQAGKVDVEEEFQQACFHISVYRKYVPEAAPPRNIAQKRSAAVALATAIR